MSENKLVSGWLERMYLPWKYRMTRTIGRCHTPLQWSMAAINWPHHPLTQWHQWWWRRGKENERASNARRASWKVQLFAHVFIFPRRHQTGHQRSQRHVTSTWGSGVLLSRLPHLPSLSFPPLISMPRTTQTARQSTGGKAPHTTAILRRHPGSFVASGNISATSAIPKDSNQVNNICLLLFLALMSRAEKLLYLR